MRSREVEPRIRKLLSSGANTSKLRNSLKELYLAIWEQEGLYLNPLQRKRFMECTPAESIARARRALRDEFPPSKEVEDRQYESFKQERADYQQPPRAISWLDED